MKHSQIKREIKTICNLFKLGEFNSFETEKNTPTKGWSTAFFSVKGKDEVFKYYFK